MVTPPWGSERRCLWGSVFLYISSSDKEVPVFNSMLISFSSKNHKKTKKKIPFTFVFSPQIRFMSPSAGQRYELQLILQKCRDQKKKKKGHISCLLSLKCLLKHLVLPNKDQIIKGDSMESIHSRSEESRPIIKVRETTVHLKMRWFGNRTGKSRRCVEK